MQIGAQKSHGICASPAESVQVKARSIPVNVKLRLNELGLSLMPQIMHDSLRVQATRSRVGSQRDYSVPSSNMPSPAGDFQPARDRRRGPSLPRAADPLRAPTS